MMQLEPPHLRLRAFVTGQPNAAHRQAARALSCLQMYVHRVAFKLSCIVQVPRSTVAEEHRYATLS